MSRYYVASVFGGSCYPGISALFKSLRAAKAWAESYGTTANFCHVKNREGKLVASFHRDTSGDGTRWFRADF